MSAINIGLIIAGMLVMTLIMIYAVWIRLRFSQPTYLLTFQALGFLLYLSCMTCSFYEYLNADQRLMLARLGFSGSIWVAIATLLFVAAFCNRPLRHWLHLAYTLAGVGLILLIANGQVVLRVLPGMQLEYHPIGRMLVILYATLGIVISMIYLLRQHGFQYKAMSLILGVAYVCTLVSNGLAPLLVGHSGYGLMALIFLNAYSLGSLLLLLYGQQIVLGRNLQSVYRRLGLDAWGIFGDPMVLGGTGADYADASVHQQQDPGWLIQEQLRIIKKHTHMLDRLERMGDRLVVDFIRQNRPDRV